MRSEPSVQCTADQAEDPLLGESAPGQDVSSGRALRGVGLRGPGCPQTASVPFQGPRSIRFGKKAEEGAGCLQIPNHPSSEVALRGPCPSGPGVPLRTWDETPPASPALCLPPRPRVWAPGTELRGALLRPTDHIRSQSPGPGPGRAWSPLCTWVPWIPPQGVPSTVTPGPPPSPREQRRFAAGFPGPSAVPEVGACCCGSWTPLCLSSPRGPGARRLLLVLLPASPPRPSARVGEGEDRLEQSRGLPRPQGTPRARHRPVLGQGRACCSPVTAWEPKPLGARPLSCGEQLGGGGV